MSDQATKDQLERLRSALMHTVTERNALRQRLEEHQLAGGEPIAIVSMACRTPGGVRTPDQLWALLAEGRDAVGDFPSDRGWNVAELYDPDPDAIGKSVTRQGGFLPEIDQFDAGFYNISPREAQSLDPQQRLLLEVSWEALERAGIPPMSLMGSRGAVFVGAMSSDYSSRLGGDMAQMDGYIGTGNALSTASGRIAYVLGLQGPAVTVDTACSASLVSLHLACQALRQGECDLALAGGVTVMSSPVMFVEFSRLRGLAPDGRCKSFSDAADGAGWAEGCGMLVLTRLKDARQKGHPVLAVIRGSAVNQDGRSQGFTAPNGPSQQRVIRDALRAARVSAADIDAVEAHGTGTALGDPIEGHALLSTYGAAHSADRPLWLGSVKSNLGHTQAASGVIGVIKMVLAMQHRLLPQTLHAQHPTRHIDWSGGQIRLVTENQPWESNGHVRRAAVSSFGISGTNAHLILEEGPPAEPAEPKAATEAQERAWPLLLSAQRQTSLPAQATQLAAHLQDHPSLPLSDVRWTLAVHRSHLASRLAVVPQELHNPTAVAAALSAFAQGQQHPAVFATPGSLRPGGLAVMFPGQGSQRPQMGALLADCFPTFRAAMHEVCELLEPRLGEDLRAALLAPAGSPLSARLDQTLYTQPAIFAFSLALFRLWESLGLRPQVLIGHSIGELVAAHVAGVLSLEDSCTLVAARARLMQACRSDGAMYSIEAPESEVVAALSGYSAQLDLAAVNGPEQCVISGDAVAAAQLAHAFAEKGRKVRQLRVSHAFHSRHMDAMLIEFEQVARSLSYHAPDRRVLSNRSGKLAAGDDLCTAEYWVRQVREAVRFADCIQSAESMGVTCYLECGPGGILAAMAAQSVAEPGRCLFIAGQRKDTDEETGVREAVAQVYVAGVNLDWPQLGGGSGRLVDLPTYSFQRQRYWLTPVAQGQGSVHALGMESAEHPLLGGATSLPDGGYLFTGRLSLGDQPFLRDHRVYGHAVVPGMVLLELALHAGRRVGLGFIHSLELRTPLVLSDGAGARLHLLIGPLDEQGQRELSLFACPAASVDESAWVCHAAGILGESMSETALSGLTLWPPPDGQTLSVPQLYEQLGSAGLQYGAAFCGLTDIFQTADGLYARVELPVCLQKEPSQFGVHPALLDAALHALGTAIVASGKILLPFALEQVELLATGAASLRVHLTTPVQDADGQLTAQVSMYDEQGRLVLRIQRLIARHASPQVLKEAIQSADNRLLLLDWIEPPTKPEETAGPAGPLAVLGSEADLLEIVPSLRAAGLTVWQAAELTDVMAQSTPPALIIQVLGKDVATDPISAVQQRTVAQLQQVQALVQAIQSPQYEKLRYVLLTRGAIQAGEFDGPPVLSQAAAAGLFQSARSEHPDRDWFQLDWDGSVSSAAQLATVLHRRGESRIAVRDGSVLVPRLAANRTRSTRPLPLPDSGNWHLGFTKAGQIDALTFVEDPAPDAPLPSGHVRVAVHATGLNFRDVLNVMGMYPGDAGPLGVEGSGVVIDVAADVQSLRVGDRVMGLLRAGFARSALADARLLAPIPAGRGFAAAATMPVAFLTAYYGLFDLAELQPGEKVLIHAAAGGVGLAAVQLCKLLGAEVYATAHPSKWDELQKLGIDAAHLSSSRNLDFKDAILTQTGGRGVDVVLNSLANEYVDASLALLPRGGRFLEMGKTDIRDAQRIAAEHAGVWYRAFDLMEAGPERLQLLLEELVGGWASGALSALPMQCYDVRQAPTAFRQMAQGRHRGKLVLCIPQPPSASGTVLVTGGTSGLGAELARHLVRDRGVKHLLLLSRRGLQASGATELLAELAEVGASVQIESCDVGDEAAVTQIIARINPAHPLTAVYHCAGIVLDGAVSSMTAEQLEQVLRPKVTGAWILHRLTAGQGLSAFVLYSSVAGLLGSPGQGNYAAANSFLDALSAYRRTNGDAALALSWGTWGQVGMAARLDGNHKQRLREQGFVPLSPSEGLELLQRAEQQAEALWVVARLDPLRLRRLSEQGRLPSLLASHRQRVRLRPSVASATESESLQTRLAALPAAQRSQVVLDLVRKEVAGVLRLASLTQVPVEQPLKELGLDSLMAVELRNRLSAATWTKVALQTVFESPAAIAAALTAALPERTEESMLPPLTVHPEARFAPFPLTTIQQAYCVGRGTFIALGGVATHGYFELDLRGLDLLRMERTVNRLIQRHDMLRAVISADGQQQQVLAHAPRFAIRLHDYATRSQTEAEAAALELRAAMSHRVLPPDQWPLFELEATRFPSGIIRLHIGLDLLIGDVRSIQLMLQESISLYADEEREPPPMEVGFRDYVLWHKQALESPRGQKDWAYWFKRLEDLAPGPELPLAARPEEIGVPRFRRHAAQLEPARWELLKKRAAARGLTPSGLLMAAFGEVLGCYSQRTRFSLNLTFFNRLGVHPQIGQVIGDFTATVLVEIDVLAGGSFETRAATAQQQLIESLDHSLVSCVDVLRELSRRGGHTVTVPIVFTSGLGFGSVSSGQQMPGVELLDVPYVISQTPQVWLDHQVVESDGELRYSWDVVDGLFPDGLVESMLHSYQSLLDMLVDDESAWTDSLLQLTPTEQLARFAEYNATDAPVRAILLHELVQEQAELRPDSLAVVDSRRRLTYAELTSQARRIGRALRDQGVQPDELVGIVMNKGWEQVVGALGVLYSGGAYLPIAAELPHARRLELLSRGNVRLVLTQPQHQGDRWPTELQVFTVGGDENAPWAELSDAPLPSVQRETQLAYVLFTSGSTGQPKGVAIEHRSALNTVLDINERFSITPADKAFGISSLSFDLSVWDLFGVLGAGGTLILPEPDALRNPARWLEWIEQEGITVWNSVPALLSMLVDYASSLPQCLRLAMLSGDWIPVPLPDRFRALCPLAQVMSLGGPTETSIWCATYPIGNVDPKWVSIPYGRPMRNHRQHILDPLLRPCPEWVTGEIYVGGVGLAREYYGDPERTREYFITHPQTGERLYKSGDLARWMPNGQIEFMGRKDHQVKIGGNRIELGEIEWHLQQHPQVGRALISTVGQRETRQIVAYVEMNPKLSGAKQEEPGVLTDPLERAAFKLEPGFRPVGSRELALATDETLPSPWTRKSYRSFAGTNPTAAQLARLLATVPPRPAGRATLDLPMLGRLLSVLRPVPSPLQPFPKFRYASAGSLYPIHVLVDLPSSMAGGDAGRYAFQRDTNRIVLVAPLTEDAPFALHLIGDVERVRRLYGSLCEEFCQLEAGYVVELLVQQAAALGLELGTAASAGTETVTLNGLLGLGSLRLGAAETDPTLEPWLVVRSGLTDLEAGTYRLTPDATWELVNRAPIDDSQLTPNESIAMAAPALIVLVGEPSVAGRRVSGRLGQRLMDRGPIEQVGLCPIGRMTASAAMAAQLGSARVILHTFCCGGISPEQVHAQASSDAPGTEEVLRRWLMSRLPAYMTPSRILVLPHMPLTSNGKIDRAALPDPRSAAPAEPLVQRESSQPSPVGDADDLSTRIAAVIAERLGLPRIPHNRPLSELGANSLALIQIHRKLREELHLELQVVDLFNHPTVAELAKLARKSAPVLPVRSVPQPVVEDAIAIVAMACRAPGGVNTPEQLWSLLSSGGDAIAEFPTDRGWNVEELYDPDPSVAGKSLTRHGGFLRQIDQFDAEFFGISPREAESLDPQQRLLLEVTWEALERAGVPPLSLEGTRTGVFVGAMSSDYSVRISNELDKLDGYVGTGSALSTTSGRLAYVLGLQGPALSVDTACSASLVSMHLASQSLRQGECDLALVGGVTVMTTPIAFVGLSRLRALSPDGRCKAFSDGADGTGWSEGCGMLVLERLSDAQAKGHPVLALVKGSAVNQDGRSQGFTAPNGSAQQRVIGDALRSAGITPDSVDAVEAHGTGTPLGDPIEAHSVMATYGAAHNRQKPLWLGSIKSNLGHTQAAAGVLGVIKMVQAMHHELLPKTLHCQEPSRHISWTSGQVRLLSEAQPWPRGAQRRRAGVSSFGISGTNAHVILEEPPSTAAASAPTQVPAICQNLPLFLSARNEGALRAQANQLAEYLGGNTEVAMTDVARTLLAHRSHLPYRAAAVVQDREQALSALTALSQGRADERVLLGMANSHAGVVMVFPGQGSQWPGMAKELYERLPVFAQTINECDAAIARYADFSVRELLLGPSDLQERSFASIDKVQPALFSMAIGLARTWQSLGITPVAVVGHSQGEVPAAYLSGALSLAEAAQVIVVRSRMLKEQVQGGAMATVGLSLSSLLERLQGYGDRVSVAVVNSANSTAIGGDADAVREVLQKLQQEGIFCREIATNRAGHSHLVDHILPTLREKLSGLRPGRTNLPMISTLDGSRLTGAELGADYWLRNLREPVRLDQAVQTLRQMGHQLFLEISAHPQLLVPLLDGAGEEGAAVATLRRGEGVERILRAAAELQLHGIEPRWDLLCGTQGRLVSLPTYPFQRSRYWMESQASGERPTTSLASPAQESRSAVRQRDGQQPTGSDSAVAQRLRALPDGERWHLILETVRTEVAAVLRLSDPSTLAPDRPLKQLGLDSIMAVEVRNRLAVVIGKKLPATLLFNYPTCRAATDYLLRDLLQSDQTVSQKAQVSQPAASTDEPIAIVAMACREPGGVQTPEAFWDLLVAGRDAIGEVPAERGWDIESLYDPDPDAPGKTVTTKGGFLTGIDQFDAEFFGMSPRETMRLDPQQRLLLEVSWEALERAGLPPLSLQGTRAGVFIGSAGSDYTARLGNQLEDLDGYVVTGSMLSTASGRIAYLLGLSGPALTVDTACSSSLVSLHLACQSLRRGECDLALSGGVTVHNTPIAFVEYSRARVLSPDGRCKAFSDAADGTGWSEGCGILVLERLSDAKKNGHPVLAVIRGSAINQDGRSQGMTAPNGLAQQQVIEAALQDAGVRPDEVDIVEAHGTGTALGDPIEAQALLNTYGRFHSEDRPLWLGSVKSNLGHNAAAAGVTGVIKMVLALQHKMMPKTLYADQPTRHVDWDSSYVRLLAEARVWEPDGHQRRAAVSAFGISGTNAHVILEESETRGIASAISKSDRTAGVAQQVPLVVSAPDVAALQAQAARLSRHLQQNPQLPLQDVAWTLVKHRSLHRYRGAVLASDHQEAASALLALSEHQLSNTVLTGAAQPGASLVFVFPGQGSQWPGMGRQLYAEVPAFAAAIDQCDEALRPHTDWSLREVLLADDAVQAAAFARVDILQPVLFAMAVALSRAWQAYGIVPSAVVGHSQGEIAAACIAGALSLPDAARVVAVRSKLLRANTSQGCMATIALPVAEIESRLSASSGDISIAVVNSGSSTVIAGTKDAVHHFVQQVSAEGIFAREIAVDYASHSADVDPVLPALRADLAGLAARHLEIPMFSTLFAGQQLQGQELDGEYWARNLREPVRLDLAVAQLKQRGHTLFLEISAHPQLLVPLHEQLGPQGDALDSLRRGHGTKEQLLRSATVLALHGHEPDWEALLGQRGQLVDLPTYAFQRQRYWPDVTPQLAGHALPAEKDFWKAVERGDTAELARSLEVEDSATHDALSLLLPKLANWRVLAKREHHSPALTNEQTSGTLASLEEWAELPEPQRREYLIDRLRSEIARILLVPAAKLDINQRLTALGLDSILAMAIKRRIEVTLGTQLSVASLLRGATVAQLAQELLAVPISVPLPACEEPQLVAAHVRPASLLASSPVSAGASSLSVPVDSGATGPWVPIKDHSQAELHLFCLPYAGGGPATFRKWAAQLPAGIHVSVLELPGRGGRLLETPYARMDELVAAILPSLVGSLSHRVPFALFGYSLGGLVAFELASQLVRKHGRCPEHLFVGGARAPWWHTEEQHALDIMQFSPIAGLPEYDLPDRELLDYLSGVALAGGSAALRDAELRKLLLPAVRADFRVFRSYVYQEQPPLPVPITAIAGRADPVVNALQLTAWKKHTTARCDVRFLPGDHSIVETQHMALVDLVVSVLQKDATDSAAG